MASGPVVMDMSGYSEKGFKRKLAVQALFGKVFYLSEVRGLTPLMIFTFQFLLKFVVSAFLVTYKFMSFHSFWVSKKLILLVTRCLQNLIYLILLCMRHVLLCFFVCYWSASPLQCSQHKRALTRTHCLSGGERMCSKLDEWT